jgi:hypothetical protein
MAQHVPACVPLASSTHLGAMATLGSIELEPMIRFERTTCCLRNSCSTTELHRPGALKVGLGLEIIPLALMT